ncbi:MAG: signal peptidase I [Chloroflexi bacterium]|nr:signal peptidase I [Chloroflexota bacterium]
MQFTFFWLFFAPTQIGGKSSYVILIGNSMLPTYERGDLVVVRPAKQYTIGDVVAYQHPEIGVVFHRIIDFDNSSFVMKGDHNFWLDSHHPKQNEIVGKLWLHIPSMGGLLMQLRTPRNFTLFVTAMIGALLFIDFQQNPKRMKRMSETKYNPMELLILFSVIAIASLVLGVVAFTKPIFTVKDKQIPYIHNGVFAYTAEVPDGVYDTNTVQPGEPIYRQVANRFTVSFDYAFITTETSDLLMNSQLFAEISNSSGWKRTLELQPSTTVGDTLSLVAVVNFADIQAFIDALETQAEVQDKTYILTIRPVIILDGQLAGINYQDHFSPELAFTFEDLVVAPIQPSAEEDPFFPQTTGMLTYASTATNTLPILGFDISVPLARMLSIITLLAYLYSLVVLFLLVKPKQDVGEVSRIQMLYGNQIVSITSFTSPQNLTEVGNIAELAKIANDHNKVILHLEHRNMHHYFVQLDEITFLYRILITQNLKELPGGKVP